MTVQRTFKQRAVSLFVAMAMIFTMIPFSLLTAFAADKRVANRVADASTMNDWTNYFPISGNITTENAGKVWLDKTVLTNAGAFGGKITQDDPDSFLVALSTIASSMSIKGMSNTPTDSILILDISGSMDDSRNDAAEELVEAANTSIAALLNTNEYNRIGVVLYSSNATTMLPLNRYTTAADGIYLTYSNSYNNGETIGIDSDVRVAGTNSAPASVERSVTGGTYIQSGIAQAIDMFTASSNSTTVNDPASGTIKRKPVMVLMSDGAPTYGTTDFSNPEARSFGSGSDSTAALGFVTQLTAAYAKAAIEEKYGNESLFYTLGLGIGNDSIATAVMNPSAENASTAIDDYWNSVDSNNPWDWYAFDGYNNVEVGGTVSLGGNRYVTKISTPLDQFYVDKYFSAEAETLPDGTVVTMADKLKAAFAEIVSEIQLQSAYFPTLIKDSEDHSGFVSFVDRIGEYMEVTDIKGILIHDDLFSGADLASNFVEGGGALGTFDNPSELGLKMVESVQVRLGITDRAVAETLIELAYRNKQLYYNNANDYSNYIGWYANAAGEFLGFYHEGVTTLPENTGDAKTDPVFVIRSYGYLGEVDAEHGVSKSDMMFATVQVRKNISTGEEIVTFAVPAALIPVVNYEVTLDETDSLTGLEVNGATAPIRLVYEVALREDINEYNILEKLSDEYLADPHNVNDDGSVNFYSNTWDHNNTTGYGTVNTYAYFNPSRQNESYYYIADELVYSDTNGTLYTGSSRPTGNKYYAYTIYKNNGGLKMETIYRKIDSLVLESAGKNADNTWYIPAGSVHVYLGESVAKRNAQSGTLSNVLMPFVDTEGHTANDEGFDYYVGATLGNNGKLTVTPETGIKLTKRMADGTTAPEGAFTFIITDINDAASNRSYPALFVDAEGNEARGTVTFENGKATVMLRADESMYIGGMTENDSFRIEEQITADYAATSTGLSGEGTVTAVANTIIPVVFTNAEVGKGAFVVSKAVEHQYGTDYVLPEGLSFKIKITLSGIGTANANFETVRGSQTSTVRTDGTGSFEITLAHGESFEVLGLPEGTTVTVVEQDVQSGFTPAYLDNGEAGDGVVTVVKDVTSSVEVLNSYEAEPVEPIPAITVTGTKRLEGRDWNGDSFEFELQKYDPATDSWNRLGDRVTVNAEGSFEFTNALANEEYDKIGAYYYRVVEIEPDTPTAGITYDKHVHSFYVVVTDTDMNGRLEINDVLRGREDDRTNITGDAQSGFTVNTSFVNTYTVNDTATVTVEVTKKIDNIGGTVQSLAGFTFGLFDEQGNLVGSTLTTTDRGFARFILDYDQNDIGQTFVYKLREIAPATIPEGWQYTNRTITVKVEVEDNGDGTISAYAYTTETRPTSATANVSETFTNTYDPTDKELTVGFVNKVLEGRDLVAGEFEFEIQGVTDPTMEPISGTNTQDGKVVFDKPLKFDSVGTYVFNVVEKGSDGNGITMDKTVYRVEITVTDIGGKLEASYFVVNAPGNMVTFRNKYSITSITHTVSGNKVLRGRPLINDEFTFVLREKSVDGVALTNPGSVTATNYRTGIFRFPAITYTKSGVYVYTISEKLPTGGSLFGITYDRTSYVYTVTVSDNGDGTIRVSDEKLELANGASVNSLTFINEYKAASTSTTITGDKTLTGKVDNALAGGEYEFILYESNANWEYSEDTRKETVANKAGGSFEFTKIDFDADEDKYYIVLEKNGGQKIDGVTYDDTVYRVFVDVTDDHKGQLHAKLHIYDGEGIPQDSIKFVNVYEITGSSEVALSGEKTLEGRDWTNEDSFVIELVGEDGQTVMTSDISSDRRSFEFKLNYTSEDVGKTYKYVLREKSGGQKINGITYSDAEYHITVVVSDNGDGTLKTVVTVENATTSTLNFVNVYEVAGTDDVTLSGEKTFEGREWTENDKFTFELYNANSSFKADGEAIKSAVANKNNKGFELKLYYNSEDIGNTYHYVLREKNAGQKINGITYSNVEYHVTVVVSDNGDGTITAAATVENSQLDALDFVNVYEITGEDSVTLKGEKTLGGREFTDNDKFTFELYNADSSFAVSGDAIKTADVTKANRVFEMTLGYKPSDVGNTYHYVLREKNAGQTISGVTYSNTEYHITVVVSDNGDGTLKAEAAVENATVNTLDFSNVYEVTGTSEITLSGNKKFEGREWMNGDKFTFELYEADSSFVTGDNALLTKDVDSANQNFAITLGYKPSDIGNTYHYVLREKNGGQTIDNITYSNVEYHITVVVSDNGDGTIKTVATVENASAETLNFVNVFVPDPESINVDVNIDKTVVNKGAQSIGPEGFEFALISDKEGVGDVKVKTDANGKAVITLNFDKDDAGKTFNYKLVEVNDGREFVEYSKAEYAISVAITHDKAENKLVATVKVDNKDVEKINASFENVYDSGLPESPQTGYKTNIGVWALMLFISGGAVLTLKAFDSKEKEN